MIVPFAHEGGNHGHLGAEHACGVRGRNGRAAARVPPPGGLVMDTLNLIAGILALLLLGYLVLALLKPEKF